MAPRLHTDLLQFSRYLVENYAATFNEIQSHIQSTYKFDFVYGPDEHSIFDLVKTTVARGNETKEITFVVFGCIINHKFFWANKMDRAWRDTIIEYNWNANLSLLFDANCVEEIDPNTIPYLISLVHSPESNVVSFVSGDGIRLFAMTDVDLSAVRLHSHFDAGPLLLGANAMHDILSHQHIL